MSNDKSKDEIILKLEKERNKAKQQFEQIQSKLREDHKVKEITSKFSAKSEENLINDNIGLASLEDFTKRRQELEKSTQDKSNEKQKLKRKRGERLKKNMLSFQDDLEEEVVQSEPKKQKLEKNPHIETAFLPDKEREEQESKEREILKKKWLERQEEIKQQEIEVTYSYWNGSGNRSQAKCKMGTTIEHFLYQIQPEWKELKRISVSDLMFVKEDVIIPHNYSFYDLITSKARGKSGPLFVFDVKDDVRIMVDSTVETEESHAAKVVDRRWFEQNKTRWPYCRWEVYDPSQDYGEYTI